MFTHLHYSKEIRLCHALGEAAMGIASLRLNDTEFEQDGAKQHLISSDPQPEFTVL